MSNRKMNELDILNALNKSRRSSGNFKSLSESYIGEAEEELDAELTDVEDTEDGIEDVDVVDIEFVDDDEDDVVDHFDDAHVDTDTDNDPDYAVINVHQTSVDDVLSDVETAIDDMDAVEDDLFDIEFVDDEDEWDDEPVEDELDADEDDVEADVEDVEDDILDIEVPEEELGEGTVYSFSGGKKHSVGKKTLKNRSKRKKGYVVMANGKRRKQTAAEKKRGHNAAVLRNLKKGHGKKARKRAAKTRAANESIWANEKAFMTLLNGVLDDARRNSRGRITESKVVSVDRGYVKGNSIVLESTVRDRKGNEASAEFTISKRPKGNYIVTESMDMLEGSDLRISGKYHMNGNRFVFDTMGYTLKTRRGTFTESFKVVSGN